MRLLLVFLLALCVVPAFSQGITWDKSVQQCQTLVSLTIPAWAQVVCQDLDGITFSSNNVTGTPSSDGSYNGGGDWWGTTKDNYYSSIAPGYLPGCDNKASTDPWAGAEYITGDPDGSPKGIYYEALDYAHHYVRTNANITGSVGNFTALTSGSNSIPAWFTLGFAPWWNAGVQVKQGNTIPFDGPGGFLMGDGEAKESNMSNSPIGLNSANYAITAPAFGTITVHARILRKGMMDVAGTYTGTITVSYQ